MKRARAALARNSSGRMLLWIVLSILASLLAQNFIVSPIAPFTKYLAGAQQLATPNSTVPLQDFSPGYLLLHRLALAVSENPATVVTFLQGLLTAIAVGLLTHAVSLLAGTGAAMVLGLLAALYAPWLLYSRILEPEACMLFLLSLFLWMTVWHFQPKRPQPLTLRPLALMALILGLACSLRPNTLLLAGTTGLALLSGKLSWAQRCKRLGIATLIFLTVPLTVHIWLRLDQELTWATPMSPEQVFHQGNNPESSGALFAYPELVRLMEEDLKGPDTAHQVYRLILQRQNLPADQWVVYARRFLIDHPAHTVGLYWNKAKLYFNVLELHDIVAADNAWRLLSKKHLPDAGWLLPLGLVGLLITLSQRQRQRHVWGALLVIFTTLASGLIFFVSARHRLASVPAWIVLAAMIWPYAESKKNRLQHFLWLIVALSVALVMVHYQGEPMISAKEEQQSARQFSQAHKRGMGLIQLLNPAKAKQNFQEAFASAPRLRPWLTLNTLEWDWREAENASEETVSTLAALARQGAWPQVAQQAALELEEHPAEITLLTWSLLAAIQNQDALALEEADSALQRYYDPASRAYEMATLALLGHHPSMALEPAKSLVKTYPEFSIGHRLLCRSAAGSKQTDIARQAFQQILKLNPHYAYDCQELYPAMRTIPWTREKFNLYFYQGHHQEICAQASGQKGRALRAVAPLELLTQSCLFVGSKSTPMWAKELGRNPAMALQSKLYLGIHYFRHHRHLQAAKNLKAVLQLNPGNPVATTYLQHLPAEFR